VNHVAVLSREETDVSCRGGKRMIQAREANRYPEKNGWLVGWLKFTGVFNTT